MNLVAVLEVVAVAVAVAVAGDSVVMVVENDDAVVVLVGVAVVDVVQVRFGILVICLFSFRNFPSLLKRKQFLNVIHLTCNVFHFF